MALTTSKLDAAAAVIDEVCLAGEPWIRTIRRGQVFRILDLEGNQAVDTLFFSAIDVEEHYSATDTIVRQAALYNIEKFFGWVSTVADFCGAVTQAAPTAN